jgi:hypothetical protein
MWQNMNHHPRTLTFCSASFLCKLLCTLPSQQPAHEVTFSFQAVWIMFAANLKNSLKTRTCWLMMLLAQPKLDQGLKQTASVLEMFSSCTFQGGLNVVLLLS